MTIDRPGEGRALSLLGLSLLGLSLLLARPAVAAPGAGTVDDPVWVDAFPYIAAGSTLGALSDAIDLYDCGPGLDESGAEVIYAFELAELARVTAWVEGDGGLVDIDVHLLDALTIDRGVATDCVARANVIAEAEMSAGLHYVVVDTFAGDDQAGDFVLHTHAIGEDWFQMPVAQGVTWRARRPGALDGSPQVLHALHVDLDAPGVALEVVLPPGCATVAEAAAFAGPTAVAAVNSSFFAGCGSPVSFMRHDGVLLATNGAGADRGAFGLDPAGVPIVGRTAPGADWPRVHEGQGGAPLLVEDGVALQGADAWAAEGLASAGFLGPNPRTVLGYDAAGDVVLATVDGRRPNAAGMSLDALASWSAEALMGQGVVNLDGGGSTTIWVGGITPSGVVNYPSDAGATEQPDHAGSRAVVGAVVVHGLPYNWPPRFQTTPQTMAAVGEAYAYDADAIDLDVDDVVTYALDDGPPGMTIDARSGEVSFAPTVDSPPQVDVTISARDDQDGVTEQTWTLTIEGAMGPGDTGVDDTRGGPGETSASGETIGGGSRGGTSGGVSSGEAEPSAGGMGTDSGCGCRSGTPAGSFGWLWVLGIRRRRRAEVVRLPPTSA
ncbi:MAG: phosphodiester glycosidase family protein [Myxococcota bacterium]